MVALFATLIVLGATANMVIPAGTHEYGVVSAEFDSSGAQIIPSGESETTTYPVAGGFVPTVVFLAPASDGVEVRPRELTVGNNKVVNATVILSAPPQTGFYRRFVVEHRYLAVLPTPTIRALYSVHPWLPIVVIDALIGVPFYLLGVALVGTGRIRRRSRDRPSSLAKLRRWLG
ncbi:MAG: hypothetical protein ABEJ61_05350 [Haloferacaceae archaeon]